MTDSTPLREKLRTYCPLSEGDLSKLVGVFEKVELKAGESLFEEGDLVDYIFYNESGVLIYSTDIDGDLSVIEFYSDDDVHTDMYSYGKGRPSVASAIAEEATIVYKAQKSKLEEVYESSMDLQRFGRKFIEHFVMHIMRRNYEKQIFSNEERYKRFVDKRFDLSQRVPQYKIASYLNITPVGLSKIRKRIFNRRK